jgi:hypothetical protein
LNGVGAGLIQGANPIHARKTCPNAGWKTYPISKDTIVCFTIPLPLVFGTPPISLFVCFVY